MIPVERSLREMTDFFQEIGAADLRHTHKTYLAHAISVYTDLKNGGVTKNCAEWGFSTRYMGPKSFRLSLCLCNDAGRSAN